MPTKTYDGLNIRCVFVNTIVSYFRFSYNYCPYSLYIVSEGLDKGHPSTSSEGDCFVFRGRDAGGKTPSHSLPV